MPIKTDEELLLDFQRGAPGALEELFERYRDPLFGFFVRRIGSRSRAEDLTQDTFMAVMKNVRRYEPRSLVRTYLFGIALNLVAAERRRLARQTGEQSSEASARSEATEQVLWIRQSLSRLDATEREILMLREYEQLSYEEIAMVLRLPLNTVRSKLFRARSALRRTLEPLTAPTPLTQLRKEL